MTAPLGLHATSDVHSGCARSLSSAESWTERARRIEEEERDGTTGARDGNGGGRESEERIERERMRGRGTENRQEETRVEERDDR